MLCKLPLKGITRERVHLALAHKGYKKKGEFEHELRVVYELIQGNKLHKERLKVTGTEGAVAKSMRYSLLRVVCSFVSRFDKQGAQVMIMYV